MAANWQVMHNSLLRNVSGIKAEGLYADFRKNLPSQIGCNRCFEFVGWLQTVKDQPALRDHAIRMLVTGAQAQEQEFFSRLCTDILILGLWPRLDALRFRLKRILGWDFPSIEQAILGEVVLQIHRADLDRIRQVAATFLLNIERNLKRPWFDEQKLRKQLTSLEGCKNSSPDLSCSWEAASQVYSGALAAERFLSECLGHTEIPEAELLFLTDIMGLTGEEAGKALSLQAQVVRKRRQRALARLRPK